jgi:hypothetical protein
VLLTAFLQITTQQTGAVSFAWRLDVFGDRDHCPGLPGVALTHPGPSAAQETIRCLSAGEGIELGSCVAALRHVSSLSWRSLRSRVHPCRFIWRRLPPSQERSSRRGTPKGNSRQPGCGQPNPRPLASCRACRWSRPRSGCPRSSRHCFGRSPSSLCWHVMPIRCPAASREWSSSAAPSAPHAHPLAHRPDIQRLSRR